jgi:hypothetical protein
MGVGNKKNRSGLICSLEAGWRLEFSNLAGRLRISSGSANIDIKDVAIHESRKS